MNKLFVFIHIPKNSGKFIRERIEQNHAVVHSFWGVEENFDFAHIPYLLRDNFIKTPIHKFFATLRNPYDRIISAYFYKNPSMDIADFRIFCLHTLPRYDFHFGFDSSYIHYYPQYMFVCDETGALQKNIGLGKLELTEKPKRYDMDIYFNKECISMINKIYQRDFLLFDYEIILT